MPAPVTDAARLERSLTGSFPAEAAKPVLT
jgi:hypothetical protein